MKIMILSVILFVSFLLNIIGINWGSTGYIPWHDDSIAGITTVREMPNIFGKWTYKYPPLQFMINSIFYKPLTEKWENNPIDVQDSNNNLKKQVLNFDRINILILISNVISALMATAIVYIIYRTATVIFEDELAGLLSALSLSFCQLFVLFSHLGNIDIPAMFWFSLGVLFLSKLAYSGKWLHFIFAGLFFSFSVSTKDTMPSYIVGLIFLATVYLIKKDWEQRGIKSLLNIVDVKPVVAAMVFLLSYAFINGMFTHLDVYMERVGIWLGGRGVKGWDKDFTGQIPLLMRTLKLLCSAFGWPLSMVLFISSIYCIIKYKLKACFGILPLVCFYLIVTVNIRFIHDRYLIPTLGCLALLIGKGLADWLRVQRLNLYIRIIPVTLIFILSFMYCLALDLELVNDSRYKAEKWFAQNIKPGEHVAVLCDIRWSPRFHMMDLSFSYRNTFRDISGTNENVLRKPPAYPKYVCVLKRHLDIFDPSFQRKLEDGSLGYSKVESFKNEFLYPQKNILGLAGWGLDKPDFVSPEVLVFENKRLN